MPWVLNFQTGGVNVSPAVRKRTERRIRAYAHKHYAGKFTRLDIRFRGQLCYIDAYQEPEEPTKGLLRALGETREQHMQRLRSLPCHLCRLRHFSEERWSLGFYTYSRQKYEPCVFEDGGEVGTPEEAFEIAAAVYLTDH